MGIQDVEEKEKLSKILKAETQFWMHHFSFMKSACIECAVNLGIPDVINKHGKPITLSHLINSLPLIHPSKAPCVYRLMRFLVNAGFFIEQRSNLCDENDQEVVFSLAPVPVPAPAPAPAGHLLTTDGPQMANAFTLMGSYPPIRKPWTHLSEWYQNSDNTAFETAHKKTLWSYATGDPLLQKLFNEAMADDSEFVAKLLTEQCGFIFEGLKSLVDVGGGTGITSRIIAKKFPNLKCFVYDQVHVVASQQGTENLEFVGGNMFHEIPQANTVLLKWILHNWNDEDCIKILKNCKKAIPSKDEGGKLIIMDIVMLNPDSKDHDTLVTQTGFDMQMLVMYNGIERTEKEFAKLFEAAGFSDYKVFLHLGFRSLIEVYP